MGRVIHLFDRATYDEQMSRQLAEGEVVDFFK
jgi:hypothetical protein